MSSSRHKILRIYQDWYRLYWTIKQYRWVVVDRLGNESRLRYPREYHRDTDEAGARRFAKKWGVKMPEEDVT